MKPSKVLYLMGGVVLLVVFILFLISFFTSLGIYMESPPCGVQCTEVDAVIWLILPGLALLGVGAVWELAFESPRKEGIGGRQFSKKALTALVVVLVAFTSLYSFTTLWRPAGSCIPLFLGPPSWASNIHVNAADGTTVAGTGYVHNYINSGAVCFYNRFGILQSEFPTDRIIGFLAATSNGSYVVAGGYQLLGFAGVYQNGDVYLFHPDGQKVWNISTGSLPVFNLQMNANGSMIVINDEGLLVTNLDGRILWQVSQSDAVPATAIIDDGSGIVDAANGHISLLDSKGVPIWNHTIGFVQSPAIAATGSNIAVGTCESGFSGTVYYMDLHGNVLWSRYTSGCITGVRFASNNTNVVVQGNSGNQVFDTQGRLLSNSTG